jgi:hypothetical protein
VLFATCRKKYIPSLRPKEYMDYTYICNKLLINSNKVILQVTWSELLSTVGRLKVRCLLVSNVPPDPNTR